MVASALPRRRSWAALCCLVFALTSPLLAASTTTLDVTATTTVHVTATSAVNACDNFYGACVVYGSEGSAPYTTTVYLASGDGDSYSSYYYSPSTSGTLTSTTSTSTGVVTSTETFIATTTVSNSGDCSGYSGACVVYATTGNGVATTTVYGDGHDGVGNSGGYIGPAQAGGQYVGAGAAMRRWTWEGFVSLALAALMAVGFI